MHVLVVGATGQIGAALLAALADSRHGLPEGVRVTALVRRRPPAIPSGEGEGRGTSPVAFIEAPTFTEDHFARALEGTTHVVYGVGLPEQFSYDPALFDRVNLGLLPPFLRALGRHAGGTGAPRLTYISTYEVFESRGGVIREDHPVTRPEDHASAYFGAMTRAYRLVLDETARMGLPLTSIHPAAVYGGLDTGYGVTHFLLNLLRRRYAELPCIVPTAFPVVHADSLAEAIVRTLDVDGPFLVSDAMSGLGPLARELRALTPCYVPPTLPVALVRPAVLAMEGAYRALHRAGLTDRPPPMSRAQLEFVTSGNDPRSDRLAAATPWRPMPLRDGLERFLARYRAGAYGPT